MSCGEPTVFWIGERARFLHAATCPTLLRAITRVMSGGYQQVHSYAYCRDNQPQDMKGPFPPDAATLHRCLIGRPAPAEEKPR